MEYLTGCEAEVAYSNEPPAYTKARVIHVIRQGKFGGGETYVSDLVRGLPGHRFQNTVIAFTDGPMVTELTKEGVDIRVVPVKFPFHRLWQIRQIVKEIDPDIIHAHGTKAATYFLPARLFAKVAFLYTVHGWSFHRGQNKLVHTLRIMLEQLVSRLVTKTICVSYANLHEGKKLFSLRRSFVIQNGASLGKLRGHLQCQKIKRADFGLADDDFVVIYLARLTYQKDPLTLLRAFEDIKRDCPKARLFVVGDGELKPEMLAFVQQHGLQDQLVFTGARNDVGAVLNMADAYVLPSLWEGLSLAMMEAMSVGLPCICSDLEANRELITHGQNGLVFPVGNHQILARQLRKLYHDPALRTRLGREAKEIVHQHFTFDRVVATHTSLYLNILGLPRHTDGKQN